MAERIVTAHVAAAANPNVDRGNLTHLVTVTDEGVQRVHCNKVKPKNILDDEAMYDDARPSCAPCARKWDELHRS